MHLEFMPVVGQTSDETVRVNVHGLMVAVLGSPTTWHCPSEAGERGASPFLPGNQHILSCFIPLVQVMTCPAQVSGESRGRSVSIPEGLIPMGGQCLCLSL